MRKIMPWTSTMHQPALRIPYALSHESSQYTHGPEYCKLHPINSNSPSSSTASCFIQLTLTIYRFTQALFFLERSHQASTAGVLHFNSRTFYWPHFCCCCCYHSVVPDSLQPHGLQHARLPWPSLSPRVCSHSGPLSWWCHPTISSSVIPSPPAFNLSQHQSLFQWVSSLHQVGKVVELQFQHQSFQWIFRVDFL